VGIPVLVIGKSGSGKSASLRNFKSSDVGVINVMGKPMPFKSDLKPYPTTDYAKVQLALNSGKVPSIVIDDAGYLITHEFMSRHSNTGKGNAVFELYNDMADKFYSLIRSVLEMPADKIVYFMMHEDKNDFGDVKPKTIGKLLDEKVCLEGLFTIVLRCMTNGQGQHVFVTQTSGFDVAKSPMGMFDSIEIDNDLKAVDAAIREYYNINTKKEGRE
jgi:hypothetical protein